MVSPATTAATLQLPASSGPGSATLPSLSTEQDSALKTLLDCRDSDILACLDFVRSIKPVFQHRSGAGPYCSAQVHAFKCLSSEPNEDVQLWLILYRRHRESSTSESERFSEGSSLKANSGPVKASYADVVKAGINSKSSVVAKGVLESVSPFKKLPPAPGQNSQRYWSTTQEHENPLETFDGFRRHEKERDNYYEFLPNGLYDRSLPEARCVLCLAPHPDKGHFAGHGISETIECLKLIRKSRKGNFEELLRNHKVPENRIHQLVKEWHHISKIKSYSCGLCVARFTTLAHRTNHLAHAHYEKGEDRKMWSFNNLIKGLLLEPRINQEARKYFQLNPAGTDSRITWDPSVAQDLQKRLELGGEKPRDLARAAYELADRLEPSFGDQTIRATGSQFSKERPESIDVMTPSIGETLDAAPSAVPARFAKDSLTDGIRHAQDELNIDIQTNDSQALSGFTLDALSELNNDYGFPENDFAFDEPTLFGQGSPLKEPTKHEYVSRRQDDDAFVMNDEHTMDVAPTLANSPHIPAPVPHFVDASCFHEVQPWHIPGQVIDPRLTIHSTPARIRQPKRQLSMNTAVAANSKPQKTAPMASQLGRGMTPSER